LNAPDLNLFERGNLFLSNILGTVFPGTALKMDAARTARFRARNDAWESQHLLNTLRTYEAIAIKRETKNVNITDQTANQELIFNNALKNLRKLARHYTKNSIFGRSIKRALVAHIVGKGATLQSRATDASGKPLTEARKEIERAWKIFSTRQCDVRGKKNFNEFLKQAVGQLIEGGEYFTNKVSRRIKGHLIPFKLQSFDADLIDEQLNFPSRESATQNQIIGGIEVDSFGSPITYFILNEGKIPFGVNQITARTHKAIPAEQMIHVYREERPAQLRGEPWITAGLKALQQTHLAVDSELFTIQIQSMLSVLYTSKTGGTGRFSGSEETKNVLDQVGNKNRTLGPASIIEIPGADNMTIVDPKRPGNMFVPFVKFIIGGIASSMDFSFGKVMHDHTDGNFSSQRQTDQDDKRGIGPIQDFLNWDFITPVFSEFLDQLVIGGIIRLPNYDKNQIFYKQADWTFTPQEFIDPLKDVAADRERMKSGFLTLTEFHKRRGVDFEDWLQEKKTEDDAIKAAKIESLEPFKVKTQSQIAGDMRGVLEEFQMETEEKD